MKDWNDVVALGNYLGMADAGEVAGTASGRRGVGRMMEEISAAASQLSGHFSPEVASDALEMLAGTDFRQLSWQRGDRYEILSDDLYRRLAALPDGSGRLPPFVVFDRHFREYLRRFAISLRAALYCAGTRKEIISLENPACRESLTELKELPCRSCGGPASPDRHDRMPASLARYIQSLLDRPDSGIAPACRTKIAEVLDHLTAYPGYYRQLDRENKASTAQALVSAITALHGAGSDDPAQADLMAALGILLFNVYPLPVIVRFLATHHPAGENRFLLYEYNSVLALNFLRMGRRKDAAVCCGRAHEAAPDGDLKAYARVLEGCIAIEDGDDRKATAALEKALETADSRSLRSLAGFYLGIVCYEAGAYGQALQCFRDARIGADGEAEAMAACNNMGTCYMIIGDLARALQSFEEADAAGTYSGRASVKFNRSVAAGNTGIVYMSMREHRLAQDQFRKALKIARETGNARGVADQLMNIGLTQKAVGDYALACHHFIAGMNYAYTIEYLEGVMYAREQIGQVLAMQGKQDEEEEIYRDMARRHPDIRKLLTRK